MHFLQVLGWFSNSVCIFLNFLIMSSFSLEVGIWFALFTVVNISFGMVSGTEDAWPWFKCLVN